MKGREYWYTEDDIQQLLNSHFTQLGNRDHVYISAQTQFEDPALLTENIRVAVAEVADGRVAILPINLHGNHWAVMVIGRDKAGRITAVYNDPLGRRMQDEPNATTVVATLSGLSPDVHIADLSYQQQSNGNDCGPYTVHNAIGLATSFLEDSVIIGASDSIIESCHLLKERGATTSSLGQRLRREHRELLGDQTVGAEAEEEEEVIPAEGATEAEYSPPSKGSDKLVGLSANDQDYSVHSSSSVVASLRNGSFRLRGRSRTFLGPQGDHVTALTITEDGISKALSGLQDTLESLREGRQNLYDYATFIGATMEIVDPENGEKLREEMFRDLKMIIKQYNDHRYKKSDNEAERSEYSQKLRENTLPEDVITLFVLEWEKSSIEPREKYNALCLQNTATALAECLVTYANQIPNTCFHRSGSSVPEAGESGRIDRAKKFFDNLQEKPVSGRPTSFASKINDIQIHLKGTFHYPYLQASEMVDFYNEEGALDAGKLKVWQGHNGLNRSAKPRTNDTEMLYNLVANHYAKLEYNYPKLRSWRGEALDAFFDDIAQEWGVDKAVLSESVTEKLGLINRNIEDSEYKFDEYLDSARSSLASEEEKFSVEGERGSDDSFVDIGIELTDTVPMNNSKGV
ncbi:MAG: hypothetical protein HON23_02270 [Rickettsiales bacterium]|jgi:hypothetical protein|nr:hypothetical protein [Rickettsiales bacterium]